MSAPTIANSPIGIPASEMAAAHVGAMQTFMRSESQGLRQWQVADGRHFAADSEDEAEALARARPLTMPSRISHRRTS